MKVESFRIEGMHCGHCASLVKKSIEIVDGVDNVEVQVGSASVSYDDEKTRRDDIVNAITRFGYRIVDN